MCASNKRSSICHGQFKLLAGQHRFRAYLTVPGQFEVLQEHACRQLIGPVVRSAKARGIDIKNVEAF